MINDHKCETDDYRSIILECRRKYIPTLFWLSNYNFRKNQKANQNHDLLLISKCYYCNMLCHQIDGSWCVRKSCCHVQFNGNQLIKTGTVWTNWKLLATCCILKYNMLLSKYSCGIKCVILSLWLGIDLIHSFTHEIRYVCKIFRKIPTLVL